MDSAQGRRNGGAEGPWSPLFSKLCKSVPLKPEIDVLLWPF